MALGLRLLAMAFLSAMFALGKLASARGVNIVEILFYRQLMALPIVLGWIMLVDGLHSVRTSRLGAHANRTLMGMCGMLLNFGSYILLPLTEATTIGFTMPIFATILSALLLKERTGIHRWAAIIIGFIGILVVTRPDTAHFPPLGLAVAIAAALMTACISLLLRDLGRTEQTGAVVFWFTTLSIPPMAVLMLFFGQAHDPLTWLLMVGMGLTGGAAQLCMTGALRWGQVSLVLAMDYSSVIWATLLGLLLWNEWPIDTTWIGAALIVGSGLYIGWREHVRGRKRASGA